MKIEKIGFGGSRPKNVNYKFNIFKSEAEVWLYDNIVEEYSEEDNSVSYYADGVYFTTTDSEDTIINNFSYYWDANSEDLPTSEDYDEPEPTLSDVIEALNLLTEIVLSGD